MGCSERLCTRVRTNPNGLKPELWGVSVRSEDVAADRGYFSIRSTNWISCKKVSLIRQFNRLFHTVMMHYQYLKRLKTEIRENTHHDFIMSYQRINYLHSFVTLQLTSSAHRTVDCPVRHYEWQSERTRNHATDRQILVDRWGAAAKCNKCHGNVSFIVILTLPAYSRCRWR